MPMLDLYDDNLFHELKRYEVTITVMWWGGGGGGLGLVNLIYILCTPSRPNKSCVQFLQDPEQELRAVKPVLAP